METGGGIEIPAPVDPSPPTQPPAPQTAEQAPPNTTQATTAGVTGQQQQEAGPTHTNTGNGLQPQRSQSALSGGQTGGTGGVPQVTVQQTPGPAENLTTTFEIFVEPEFPVGSDGGKAGSRAGGASRAFERISFNDFPAPGERRKRRPKIPPGTQDWVDTSESEKENLWEPQPQPQPQPQPHPQPQPQPQPQPRLQPQPQPQFQTHREQRQQERRGWSRQVRETFRLDTQDKILEEYQLQMERRQGLKEQLQQDRLDPQTEREQAMLRHIRELEQREQDLVHAIAFQRDRLAEQEDILNPQPKLYKGIGSRYAGLVRQNGPLRDPGTVAQQQVYQSPPMVQSLPGNWIYPLTTAVAMGLTGFTLRIWYRFEWDIGFMMTVLIFLVYLVACRSVYYDY